MLLKVLDTVPDHPCGRGCDVCAEAIGAAALGVIPAYSATLSALADASERKRTARTLGEFLDADSEVKRLRESAARLMPMIQRFDEVASC